MRWPTATGEVTETRIEDAQSRRGGIKLTVFYKFVVGDDGPFVGESSWEPFLPENDRVFAAGQNCHVGQTVLVRYRPDDASINKVDPSVWRGL